MFLETHSAVPVDYLLENLETFQKDFWWLRDNDMFYDYTEDMDDVLWNRKQTGHFWQLSAFFYNKDLLQNLPEGVADLETVKIIQSLPVKPILGTFSIMEPHSILDWHEGHDEHCIAGRKDTYVIKYHIGIDVADNDLAGLNVGEATGILKNGKLHVFNEGMQHWAYNDSDHRRGVLILSFLACDLGV
jgi:hypothetical protein